jgi:threonine aldolase
MMGRYRAQMRTTDAELERLRRACTRALGWHGERSPTEQLNELPNEIAPDRYGVGGIVEALETSVAELLGVPAALFLPSGTMAQQIALRIHSDRRGRRTVAFHPACHLDQHEHEAFQRLHGLARRPLGELSRLLTLDDLEGIAEPLAALVLELPQRDLGGRLPVWDDLVAQTAWARDHGAAVHLDGARLWQCAPAYDRSLAEIAALFDTVYVSFYKDLGALAGCCLAGRDDVIAEAREWRQRHGGTLFAMWPYAASALAALRTRWPRMAAYRECALAIASALTGLDGVRVDPDPPHTSMMHLYLRTTDHDLRTRVARIATEQQIWTWRASFASGHPEWRVVELTVGDATMAFAPSEVRSLIAELVER